MKIYFKVSSLENHKFTKIGSEKVILLDFKKLWFSYKDRIISQEISPNCEMFNTDTMELYKTDAHDTYIYCYTLARINLFRLKDSWFNKSYIIHYRIRDVDYKNLS